MLVDTDVLIWNLRGNAKAAEVLDGRGGFALSSVTYMELVQGLRNKDEFVKLRRALGFWDASVIHINESISFRASYLIEQHCFADGLQLADALIAATALDCGEPLLTANTKHYRQIEGIALEYFEP